MAVENNSGSVVKLRRGAVDIRCNLDKFNVIRGALGTKTHFMQGAVFQRSKSGSYAEKTNNNEIDTFEAAFSAIANDDEQFKQQLQEGPITLSREIFSIGKR